MKLNVWPATNVVDILLLKPGSDADSTAQSGGMFAELFQRHLRWSTYVIIAVATWMCGYTDLIALAAPPVSTAAVARLFLIIAARNLAIVHAFYGGWHWFLYERAQTARSLAGRKFNPANIGADGRYDARKGYDPVSCRRWATSGALIESVYETLVVLCWAAGTPYYTDFWSRPLWSVGWMLFVGYWRDGHFFWAHRAMHPWFGKTSRFASLDVGRLLYTHAHALHHKSYNTGPWSGLSMHPVEHVVYFSCVFFPCLVLPQHPLHFLFNHYHVLISPLPGHDGYDFPGGGSYYHYLHQ